MHGSDDQSDSRRHEPVALRPQRPEDEPFLRQVYASTREEELNATGWDAATRTTFLALQFKAMSQGYRSMFPAAEFSIIQRGGQPIGRMVIDRTGGEIRVVDVALLPEHRRQGTGTHLMRRVCAQAAAAGKPVRLCVLRNSPAVRWYERLGFARIKQTGFYDEMEWRPAGAAPSRVGPGG